jgi:hypothetical protein
MKHIASVVMLSCIALNAFAQTPIRTETITIPISSIREDVKAIGMGKTQVGNGIQFNAMMYNPALLANERSSFELPSLQASLPTKSFSAVTFLVDNLSQFTKGMFVKDIKGGVSDYRAAQTDNARLAALRRVQNGLRFINDLQDKVGGTTDNPRIHGLSAGGALQGQFGNFGMSVYGIGQTAFTVYSSRAVSELAKIKIPQSSQEITVETLAQLGAAADALLNQDGSLKDGAAPTALAVSYGDLVVAGGYGAHVTDELSVGANLKFVTRHFSSKLIEPSNYDNIWKELRKDFEKSVTGLTGDVGAMYKLKKTGTQLGVSVQNIIPVGTVSSALTLSNYGVDVNGNAVEQRITIPFELKMPVLVNVGATHPIMENWDVSFDVTDLASQDGKYEDYIERLRVGTEYRLQASNNGFGVAFRGGLADKRPTFGIGLNFGPVVQIDGAYAFDNYVGENSYFAQLKFGW